MDEQLRLVLDDFVSDRTPRPLMAPVLNFNLPVEISRLRGEIAYDKGHNAVTLIKHSEFRVVLVALRKGAEIHEQAGPERIALHAFSGHLRLHLRDEVVNLHPDQLLSLERAIAYRIEAVEDAAFLLFVGWSGRGSGEAPVPAG